MRLRARLTFALVAAVAVLPAQAGRAGAAELPFDDGLFRRCISWMLSGEGGALIDNLCAANYALPSPSLFMCARKSLSGFDSAVDREVCAVIFDEQAKKARAGKVR
jgi:hypothetical protein